MYPYLLPAIFEYTVPMYDLFIGIGIVLMLLYIAKRLENHDGYSRKQTNKILILVAMSLLIALGSSYLFDGIFHSIQEGELTFGSITFIGGLIGGLSSFWLLLKYAYKDDNKNMKQIMNTIIVGVVLAHAFGRIGCYFAGCCYGIPTESFLGVVFPYGHAHTAFPGIALFPTQLFEAAFLYGLFVVLNVVKKIENKEVEVYLLGYGLWRILLEFIRGDDRGSFFPFITTQYNQFPTPSQYLSLLMILFGLYLYFKPTIANRLTKSNKKVQ